jgi:hypothetical protein
LHTIIFGVLVQNGFFGNPNSCKLGLLPKEIEEEVGWMKRTKLGRPKVANSLCH